MHALLHEGDRAQNETPQQNHGRRFRNGTTAATLPAAAISCIDEAGIRERRVSDAAIGARPVVCYCCRAAISQHEGARSRIAEADIDWAVSAVERNIDREGVQIKAGDASVRVCSPTWKRARCPVPE